MSVFPFANKISRENYSEKTPNNTIRSDMGVGPAKVRRRTVLNVREVSFSMALTDEELGLFDDFYQENEPVIFSFDNPRTNLQDTARFKEPPTYARNESMWSVNVTLEILP